jgi:hypothetical protein
MLRTELVNPLVMVNYAWLEAENPKISEAECIIHWLLFPISISICDFLDNRIS